MKSVLLFLLAAMIATISGADTDASDVPEDTHLRLEGTAQPRNLEETEMELEYREGGGRGWNRDFEDYREYGSINEGEDSFGHRKAQSAGGDVVDFKKAERIMKNHYQGYFSRCKENFGRTDKEYIAQMVAIRDRLKESGAVRSLQHDPWAIGYFDLKVITIDVLVLYTSEFRKLYPGNTKNRLRTTEMLTNVALFQTGIGVRMRFKILPLGTGLSDGTELSADEYRALRKQKDANLSNLATTDGDIKSLRERWGADVVLLAVAPNERIWKPSNKANGCGTAYFPNWKNPTANFVAGVRVGDSGDFKGIDNCAEIFTPTHELGHLFGIKHPTELGLPHEAEVADNDFPWRVSMMGYRDNLCEDIKSQCLRTLSFIPDVLPTLRKNAPKLANINEAIDWGCL